MRKPKIDFLGNRKYMFAFSALLLVVAIGSLAVKGLTFGIEFQGGTAIDIENTGDITIEEIRAAFVEAGVRNANVQTSEFQGDRGFIVRTDVIDPQEAAGSAQAVAAATGIARESFRVTTIGPGWGANITNRALLALGISIGMILLYVSIRFE